MQRTGKVTVWKDEKGFGFITPNGGGDDVFFHISAFARAQGRPTVGDIVVFTLVPGKNGKMQAERVQCVVSKTPPTHQAPMTPVRLVPYLLMVFCVGMGIVALVKTGLPLVLAYPFFGLLTYTVYDHDKRQAQAGGRRVPEAVLHLLEVFGGWMGGYLAQQSLRHKTVKMSYQVVFWGIIILHCLGWASYLLQFYGIIH